MRIALSSVGVPSALVMDRLGQEGRAKKDWPPLLELAHPRPPALGTSDTQVVRPDWNPH